MNKKVLKTMIGSVVVFLVALYVLKIFFPEQFVMVVENEQFIKIGNYIDTHKWASIIFGFVIGFIGDYLYFGAVCRTTKLKWHLILIMCIYGVLFELFYNLADMETIISLTNVIIAIQSAYMILIPMFYTKELKPLSITYSIHYLSQALSLSIRNLALLITNANSIVNIFMCFESYLWLILLFSIFNYKKKENINGTH